MIHTLKNAATQKLQETTLGKYTLPTLMAVSLVLSGCASQQPYRDQNGVIYVGVDPQGNIQTIPNETDIQYLERQNNGGTGSAAAILARQIQHEVQESFEQCIVPAKAQNLSTGQKQYEDCIKIKNNDPTITTNSGLKLAFEQCEIQANNGISVANTESEAQCGIESCELEAAITGIDTSYITIKGYGIGNKCSDGEL